MLVLMISEIYYKAKYHQTFGTAKLIYTYLKTNNDPNMTQNFNLNLATSN